GGEDTDAPVHAGAVEEPERVAGSAAVEAFEPLEVEAVRAPDVTRVAVGDGPSGRHGRAGQFVAEKTHRAQGTAHNLVDVRERADVWAAEGEARRDTAVEPIRDSRGGQSHEDVPGGCREVQHVFAAPTVDAAEVQRVVEKPRAVPEVEHVGPGAADEVLHAV